MAADKHNDYPDDSQGVVRSDIVRPHRLAAGVPGGITPIDQHRLASGRLGDARRNPRMTLAEEDRLNRISAAGTHLLQKPVPNITPNYGPTENGKREYTLQLQQDTTHGGYHALHMLLGADGGGKVDRETGAVVPLGGGQVGIEYRRTIAVSHFSFEEMVQMAVCACDARGMTWNDTCRFIEQTLKSMQDQLPEPPPQRGA